MSPPDAIAYLQSATMNKDAEPTYNTKLFDREKA